MYETDWLLPLTAVSATKTGANTAWSLPTRALTQNDSGAYAILDPSDITHWLRLTNYGIVNLLPADAILSGIAVKVRRTNDRNYNYVIDQGLYLRTAAGDVGNDKSLSSSLTWPSGYVDVIYGGGDDLWGSGLTAADICTTGFGVDFSVKGIQSAYLATVGVDTIWIKIYYNLPNNYRVDEHSFYVFGYDPIVTRKYRKFPLPPSNHQGASQSGKRIFPDFV